MFRFKSTKKFCSFLIVSALSLSLVGCSNGKKSVASISQVSSFDAISQNAAEQQTKFDEYLDELFREEVVCDTLTLHYTLAHPEEYGIDPPEPTFGEESDYSDEALQEELEGLNDELEKLADFDYKLLSEEQKYTYELLADTYELNIESHDYLYYYEPFSYTGGLHVNFPITMSEYKFYDKEDVDDYIALLAQTKDYFNQYLTFEDLKIKNGTFMNSYCAGEVVRKCQEFIANPEKNLLIETFNSNILEVEGLTDGELEGYKELNRAAVMEHVIPAYEDTIAYFRKHSDDGENDLGLCYLEKGKEYYSYLLKSDVGTDKTPEEIIELLNSSLDESTQELYSVVMSNYDAYLEYFEEDSIYNEIDPYTTIDYFQEEFKDRFPELPDYTLTVEPVHESLEDMVNPAFYMIPPLDDYESNSIYTNLGSDGAGSIWSTLAHEAIPGHLYQSVYYRSTDPNPLRGLLSYSGYCEGWATYVEQMSYEYYDGYTYDCYADLERINNEISLAVSARVDIGVNYEGWTLEDTKDYLNNNGFNGDVAQDIMNYVISDPCTYQVYVIGWLEFESLRDYAETELGDSFNEADFHKVLLDAGPSPFYLLEDKVNKYVESVK